MAADLADHAEGVSLLRFHLYQPSVLEGCSYEAAGGTDAAEAVPGLRHHVLRSRDSERESVRFRRISATQSLSSVNTASVSNPNPFRDGTYASRWYLRLISVRTIPPSAIAKLFPSGCTRTICFLAKRTWTQNLSPTTTTKFQILISLFWYQCPGLRTTLVQPSLRASKCS